VSRRSLVTTIASGVLALVLLIALIRIARVDLAQVLRLLADVRLLPFAALLILTSLHILLAGEKWRLVQRRIAPGAELSRRLCFCFTAVGTAAGQILPMQVATALTRSLGSHLTTGSGAVRGALTTVFEQMFDIVVVALCGLASIYCLWRGDTGWWAAAAGAALAVGFMLAGPALGAAAAGTRWLAAAHMLVGDRLGGSIERFARTLAQSGLFDEALTRRLFVLSVLRFIVLWLMTVATMQAVALNVSSVQIAAALPLVVLATALAVTPGGIGVNEWTFAAALTAFGVDFETATQCALINRVLVAIASLTIGVLGAGLAQLAGKTSDSPQSSGREARAMLDR
jgi:uncharacterized membrane protein YbhN (UPF0104 family)